MAVQKLVNRSFFFFCRSTFNQSAPINHDAKHCSHTMISGNNNMRAHTHARTHSLTSNARAHKAHTAPIRTHARPLPQAAHTHSTHRKTHTSTQARQAPEAHTTNALVTVIFTTTSQSSPCINTSSMPWPGY